MEKRNDEQIKLFTMKLPKSKLAHYKLMAKNLGLPLSQLIQYCIDGKKFPKKMTQKRADPEMIRQVAAIGNNLNQIARRLNSGESIEVYELLITIEKKLDSLL